MNSGMISGPPIRKFREGWAHPLFNGSRAHYFQRVELGMARALCGHEVPAGQLLEPGNWTQCMNCWDRLHAAKKKGRKAHSTIRKDR